MAYINTKTFVEIFPTSTEFISNFTNSVYKEYIKDTNMLEIIYDLLLSKYENSHIASLNEEGWKRKVNSTLFSFGPTFIKKLEIQKTLRELTEKEIMTGAVAKSTRGYNPSDVPGTANSDTEIETVNEQSLQKYTKSKLDGYNNLLILLKEDVTSSFINKFRKLFMITVDLDDVLDAYDDGGSN